ncbi:glucan biosynthesis protein [Lysobacter silvisoli]|uniref:Glucans biosynthesis protein D n=1 Tax=Lysobacter silvisoli TaxID=2293254 RepID=A0A371K1Y1_9GAMM|nr:glucan biosynthesis protein G [Lysobacter silvisoli]RDZ27872.1 glucan biosynthesis protein D [Lysobacter silvisoli]
MRRRELVLAGLSWPVLGLWGANGNARAAQAAGASASAGEGEGALQGGGKFDDGTVPALASALAAQPFRAQSKQLPASLEKIGYDQYRSIRYNPDRALWRAQGLPFQAQFFHRGFFFRDRVDIFEVADGRASPVTYKPEQFRFDGTAAPRENDLGYAGFRLHAPINRADYFDEVCAFLGASYFRAVAKGQAYGLSARGLALKTADPAGEEFPVFRAFWLQRPARGENKAVVHALMDSPSVAGAFRFEIVPGAETVFDVSARLYPRVALDRVGIAPLTSMYQFDASDRHGIDDYRPAVHDSDGLALINGRDEQIWRPLHNPSTVQESAFEDRGPRGYGLMQRKRAFADYADSEAHYERRPSLWVEPKGDWGEGSVRLIEIPTADEFHDNIVAYWRPAQPLAAGREHRYDYRLHWCDRHEWKPALARVTDTRIGAAGKGVRRVVIDLQGGTPAALPAGSEPRAVVSASQGRVSNAVAHAMPGREAWRIAFELDPEQERSIELRARLEDARGPLSETWLYRWTA